MEPAPAVMNIPTLTRRKRIRVAVETMAIIMVRLRCVYSDAILIHLSFFSRTKLLNNLISLLISPVATSRFIFRAQTWYGKIIFNLNDVGAELRS
jgi:hypothetical protein